MSKETMQKEKNQNQTKHKIYDCYGTITHWHHFFPGGTGDGRTDGQNQNLSK